MNKILLIDGNSLAYRAFYGSAYSPQGILKNSKGTPVNAILIFNRIISNAISKYEPTHVFVAFDSGKKTNRHDKLDSYKGGRSATPPELIIQFPLLKQMLDKMGIKRYEIPKIEADDIIATMVKKFSKDNNVLVFSSDKDLYQLVDDKVTIIVPQNGNKENKIIEKNDFFMKTGYHPCQVTDIKGLVGDASDNLPGVKGIGVKGAIKLLLEYKTLEGIYNNLDNLSTNLKNKLLNSKEMAFLCKELATLEFNVELPFKIQDIFFKERSTNNLISFFKDLEINSLVKKYEKMLNQNKKSENIFNDTQEKMDNILL